MIHVPYESHESQKVQRLWFMLANLAGSLGKSRDECPDLNSFSCLLATYLEGSWIVGRAVWYHLGGLTFSYQPSFSGYMGKKYPMGPYFSFLHDLMLDSEAGLPLLLSATDPTTQAITSIETDLELCWIFCPRGDLPDFIRAVMDLNVRQMHDSIANPATSTFPQYAAAVKTVIHLPQSVLATEEMLAIGLQDGESSISTQARVPFARPMDTNVPSTPEIIAPPEELAASLSDSRSSSSFACTYPGCPKTFASETRQK
jgi:hypothetical protein